MAKVLNSPATVLAVRSTATTTSSSSNRGVSSPVNRLGAARLSSQFWGNSTFLSLRSQEQQQRHCSRLKPAAFQVINTAPWLRWWDKDGAPNMVEIHSMQEFIDALSGAGERLVIVDFYARSCNGCRTLYPKLCKIAREHPEVVFLKINYDENTDICKALNVKVLPLFFVYRAQGHLESFSCTISKIQRLRDAIAKYSDMNETPSSAGVVMGSLLAKAGAAASPSSKRPAATSEAVAI